MLEVLYEDNHLLAVNKPAMLPTMGVAEDRPSLLVEAKEYIRRKYNKPGNVYLGIVSRLDAPVTGVVLLARTSKAAGRLSKQFRERDVEKVYWALVEGRVEPPVGQLTHFMRKDERHRRMHVTGASTPGAQLAELRYRVLTSSGKDKDKDKDKETRRQGDQETRVKSDPLCPHVSLSPCPFLATLLEVQLLTGRKHQIRVQLSDAGYPILGDRKYGNSRPFPLGIALHARRLVIEHPVNRIQLAIEAPLPASWRRFVEGG